jgi:hypothetical protein
MDSAARNEADAAELLGELRTALAVEQRAEQALNEQRAPSLKFCSHRGPDYAVTTACRRTAKYRCCALYE